MVASFVSQIQGHFTILTLTGLAFGFGGASHCSVQGVLQTVRNNRG
jgi:hypothetical protein